MKIRYFINNANSPDDRDVAVWETTGCPPRLLEPVFFRDEKRHTSRFVVSRVSRTVIENLLDPRDLHLRHHNAEETFEVAVQWCRDQGGRASRIESHGLIVWYEDICEVELEACDL